MRIYDLHDKEGRAFAFEIDNVAISRSTVAVFPLDHELIAREIVRVPRADVLNHWPQFELADQRSWGVRPRSVVISIDLDQFT
jgi:hypothetical protein